MVAQSSPFVLFIESELAAIVGLCCSIVVAVAFGAHLYSHLTQYNVPKLQRYALRVCAIIPIYCINSFFAVFIESIGFYADTLKEMYEGFVIYNFLMMCLASVGYDSDLVNFWNRSGNPPLPSSWLWSTCCCGHVPLDHRFLVRCKQGVLQFVVVKLVMAVVILLCNELGAADAAWIYIFIIYNVAYTVALYALFAFYLGTKELLQPFKPVMKFVMVKAIIFVTFWQSIAVSACISNGLISFVETPEYSRDRFQKRLQNFFIVVESVPAVLLNWRFFQPRDFHGELPTLFVLPPTRCGASLCHLLSVRDVFDDLQNSFSANEYAAARHETAADLAANLEHVDVGGGGDRRATDARDGGDAGSGGIGDTAHGGALAKKSQAVLDELEANRLDVDMEMEIEMTDADANASMSSESDPEMARAWHSKKKNDASKAKLVAAPELVDWSNWQSLDESTLPVVSAATTAAAATSAAAASTEAVSVAPPAAASNSFALFTRK